MNHVNETFTNARIELHGKTFHDCTFEHCELVFDGDRPPTFGAATRTLYLLSHIYHAGEGGREVVERMLSDLREHNLHGHEIRTIVPHTADGALN